MKIISKRISRNEFVSRKDGVIPSLIDMWIIPETQLNCGGSESYVFNTYPSAAAKMRELGQSPSLLEYKAEFVYQDHNYGLIVSDVIIPESAEIIDENGKKITVELSKNITDYTDIYANIPIEDKDGEYYDLNDKSSKVHYEGRKIMSGGTEIKILTYSTLNKWYTFFKNYFSTIKMYDNAIGLYNAECVNKHEDNMKYFKDLDDLFEARGGKYMYFWIVQYCMPHDNDDIEPKETFPADVATNSASYVIPVLLTNSIDDLGEMTIFSTKWKDGVDYHNRAEEIGKCDRTHKDEYNPPLKEFIDCNKQKDDQCFGTVVDRPYKYESDDIGKFDERYLDIDYETYMIKSGDKKGYKQNKYKENEFKNDDWVNYTEWDICNNPDKYSSFLSDGKTCVSTYAYSPINGAILYNPAEDCERQKVAYTKKDYILSNGNYIEVVDGYYTIPSYTVGCSANVVFKRGIKLPVIEDGALKYAELNGRRFYALKDEDVEKIYFTKKSNCYDPGSVVIKSKYILYDGSVFPFSDDSKYVIINNDDETFIYAIFNGYFAYKGVTYFINGNDVGLPVIDVRYVDDKKITEVKFKELEETDLSVLGWKSVSVGPQTGEVTICHKLDIKNVNLITGYTDSKLDLLRRRKINTDEMGTELPGYLDLGFSAETTSHIATSKTCSDDECVIGISEYYETVSVSGSNYNTPYDQCVLDILYKVGEVSGLEFQKTITVDGKEKNLFNGNYLEKIVFYYLDENGERLNETSVSGSDSREVLQKFDEGKELHIPNEILYCDITYYIGATLEYDEENSRYIPSFEEREGEKYYRHKGVKYIDTLTVTKSLGKFYMSDGSFFTFNYYQLRGNMSDQYLDDFKDNKLVNMSYFEMETMNFCNKDGIVFETDYWENNNGMISAPVFRTEYNLFSSTPQKSKSDIYIDRGVNSAFETHIKLQEVHTLDALENYSNGYFKINEY